MGLKGDIEALAGPRRALKKTLKLNACCLNIIQISFDVRNRDLRKIVATTKILKSIHSKNTVARSSVFSKL